MDIRATGKQFVKLNKLYNKHNLLNKDVVTINNDSKADIPIIMIKDDTGSFIEWTKGYKNVASFIKYGYVRIIKNCPYHIGKCKGEKCQLYIVQNNTGDCAHLWSGLK